MTDIDFHFNAADKVSHTCRLLRKAVALRATRLVVCGEPALLAHIDAALWQVAPCDFITHCGSDAAPHVAERSSVLLASETADVRVQHRPVLVNLGEGVPAGFERFERLIEIVTADEADRQRARARWRHYADRGYAIRRHDMAGGVVDER